MTAQFPTIAALLDQDRKGHTLPQGLYVGQEAFEFDTQVLLKSVWLYACTVAHVKRPGDFFVFEFAHVSVIIVRGRDQQIRAFHNSCRHRGSKICLEQRGHSPRLMCPYHQWTYGLDGGLLAARGMADGFDKADHGLNAVSIENIGGLLFVCLADNPPPIDRVSSDIAEQIAPYDLEHCKVAVQDELIEAGNWKLVMENNRECYHCDRGHPELINILGTNGFGKGLPEDGGVDSEDGFEAMVAAKREQWKALGVYHDLVEFPGEWWHRIARLPLQGGAVTQTIDGKLACQKLIGPFTEPETSSLSVWTEPNSWHHFCCDHVVSFSLVPLAADKSLLRTSWLVHEDAVEGIDYDPAHLTALWRATNAQDGFFSTINHLGISGAGYVQGPYAMEEKLVEHFKEFYVEKSKAALMAQCSVDERA